MAKAATKAKKEKEKKVKPRIIGTDKVAKMLHRQYDGYAEKQLKTFVRDVFLAVGQVLTKEAHKGGSANLSINGFGTFKITKTKERNARNPRTGETIKVAPKMVVKCKISSSIKRAVAASENGTGKKKSGKSKSKKK